MDGRIDVNHCFEPGFCFEEMELFLVGFGSHHFDQETQAEGGQMICCVVEPCSLCDFVSELLVIWREVLPY